MSKLIEQSKVGDVAKSELISVKPSTKIELVAKLFDKHDINAAPVVDGMGKCVGVITSHILVQYEANRTEFEEQSLSGIAFDLAPGADGQPARLVGRPFDEVAYHMSSDFDTIKSDARLSEAGRLMCQKHLHHLITVDDAGRPHGMLSALDIIGELLGEPVQRLDRATLIEQRKN